MKALIIEDEKTIAEAIKRGLEQEAFVVDVTFDGESGYDMAATEDYDVIVLDRMLPKMSGMQICARLRQEEIQTPILMLTAKGEVEDRIAGLNQGADDYLPKPFSFEELLARLRALTRRPKKSLKAILKVDDLELDTINLVVTRAGQEIRVSKKELALLEYLMKNQGNVLTKEQIIEKVWDFDADVLPNTVEVYIGYLRNKIDKPFRKSKPLIHTIRGFGYRLGER